jgi:hypothetical protein
MRIIVGKLTTYLSFFFFYPLIRFYIVHQTPIEFKVPLRKKSHIWKSRSINRKTNTLKEKEENMSLFFLTKQKNPHNFSFIEFCELML